MKKLILFIALLSFAADFAFVNQKTVGGKTYKAYRNIENPKDVYIECDGQKKPMKSLKLEWPNLKPRIVEDENGCHEECF